jgi:hypothetical protein
MTHELRKERALSLFRSQGGGEHFWQVYLDNFDEFIACKKEAADCLVSVPSEWQTSVRRIYQDNKLPRHPKKSINGQDRVEILGALAEGRLGIVSPKPEKLAVYMGHVWQALVSPSVSRRALQCILGGLLYCSQFRRPAMSTFDLVWPYIS